MDCKVRGRKPVTHSAGQDCLGYGIDAGPSQFLLLFGSPVTVKHKVIQPAPSPNIGFRKNLLVIVTAAAVLVLHFWRGRESCYRRLLN